jgi:hypothetical protein
MLAVNMSNADNASVIPFEMDWEMINGSKVYRLQLATA